MNLELCRLCYENEAGVDIFQEKMAEIQIFTKIVYCCGPVSIHKNDGLPSRICSGCECKLDECYRFVLRCEAADKKLRGFLNVDNLMEESKRAKFTTKSEVKTEVDVCDDYENMFEDCIKPEFEEIENNISPKKRSCKKRMKSHEVICSECGKNFISLSALTVHLRTHTNERPFKCSSCDKTYKDSGTLKRHTERNHLLQRERKFVCEYCGNRFYSKPDIIVHMRVHTRETPYSCPLCPSRFTQVSAMLRHKRRHTDPKSFACSACSKAFWTKDELNKHLSVHEEIRKFSCPICNVLFKQKNSVQKHMRIHAEPNRFVCNHCGKTFNTQGSLTSHTKRKHSERSGFCNICSKNVSNIEVHMWTHTGERPLKCEVCTRSFISLRALALHVNFKHTQTDKFKCIAEGCLKNFPSKPMLEFHVAKFHKKQTLHPCDRCSRSFYRKSDLARHKLGTHKEKLM